MEYKGDTRVWSMTLYNIIYMGSEYWVRITCLQKYFYSPLAVRSRSPYIIIRQMTFDSGNYYRFRRRGVTI